MLLLLSVSSALAIDWNQFKVFDGTTEPYAANGPGCRMPGMPSEGAMVPGQNCPENNSAFDLGAVWVDRANGYIAWKIIALNLSDAAFCGGTKNNSDWQLAIQFDKDDNISTGCPMGFPCYPGADFRLWLWGDGRFDFEILNESRINVTCFEGMPGMCYDLMSGDLYNITFNYTCDAPSILLVAINESGVNVTAMQFAIELTGSSPGPADMLGGFSDGEFVDKFMLGGEMDFMFEDQHPCFSYDHTTETDCTTNTANITGADNCLWRAFEQLCDPDFSVMNCTQFCGACNSTVDCQGGAKGKCMVVSAPPITPPDAKVWDDSGNKMCVEDMAKFMMNGKESCDNDCKFCFSNETCSNSAYPNPIGTGSGCKWVVDPFFGGSWCDLATAPTSGSNSMFECRADNMHRCFNQSDCEATGGNWSTQFMMCYNESREHCFDGEDNDGDALIDCLDLQDCFKDPACGGDIDLLTGGYGDINNPYEAMKKKLFGEMDPSPPVMLFGEPSGESWPSSIDALQFMVKDMGNALGMGIAVDAMDAASLLCNGTQSGRYYYYIDSDANTSTGCAANISNSSYEGFEYRYEYEIQNNGSNSPLEIRRGYRCLPDGNFSIYPAKMSGSPDMYLFGQDPEKVSCVENVALIAVDKTDLGNPKGNLRFMVATADNNTAGSQANDTLLGPGNQGIYYTPGAIDFQPSDCSANPMACGTAFGIIGGGKFMPFEDCFIGSGDEDLDGLTDCQDPDCLMVPWCTGVAGAFNISQDKTAPTVFSTKAETFDDFVFLHMTTNEPTNLTINFYQNCMNSTAVNTFIDLGMPNNAFDDFRPWHDFGIRSGDLDAFLNSIGFIAGQSYFYKMKLCDQAGNCGTSACLNFTMASSAQQFNYKFDFVPPPDPMINTTVIKIFNGSDYINVSADSSQNTHYLKDAKLKFDNPDANWEIEFEGIDLAKAVNFNISTALNVTNSSGKTYVGMQNQKWLDMAQNLGVESISVKIPGSVPGDRLEKCDENNLSKCVDVTSQAIYNATSEKWTIPTSLGFSTYTVGATTYNLSFVNLSSINQTGEPGAVLNVTLNLTNWENTTRVYNLSTNVGSLNESQVNLSENESQIVILNYTNVTEGTNAAIMTATLFNDSSVALTSEDDLGSIYFSIVNSALSASVIYPENTTYTNRTVNVTISAPGNNTIWFVNASGENETYAAPTTTTYTSDGSKSLFAYANDSYDNIRSANVTFVVDTSAPNVTATSPSGSQASATSATLSVTTDENATCRYSATDVDYDNMTSNFTDSVTSHTASVSVTSGSSYTYYVRCADAYNHTMNSSSTISFSIATASPTRGGGGGGGGAIPTSSASDVIKVQRMWIIIPPGVEQKLSISEDEMELTSIEFTVSSELASAELVVNAYHDMPSAVTKAAGSKVYQYLRLTKTGLDDSVLSGNVKMRFRISRDWILDNDINLSTIMLKREVNGTWTELFTRKTSEDSDYLYFLAETPGFSYFAISAEPNLDATTAPADEVVEDATQELESTVTNEGPAAEAATQSQGEETDADDGAGRRLLTGLLIEVGVLVLVALLVFFIIKRIRSKPPKYADESGSVEGKIEAMNRESAGLGLEHQEHHPPHHEVHHEGHAHHPHEHVHHDSAHHRKE
ncbi:PGF-pre-PGF domain-containing protein [Candidatus Woesearchaeota archaeon]|nr:PGF-pre-PGF domain-containing protein [Candidatus Woesearchaeota archaeon]